MLNESIPTAAARTASSTALRMAWSPAIGCPDRSTVTGRNVSRPNSNVDITCSPLQDRLNSNYLSTQTNEHESVFRAPLTSTAVSDEVPAHLLDVLDLEGAGRTDGQSSTAEVERLAAYATGSGTLVVLQPTAGAISFAIVSSIVAL